MVYDIQNNCFDITLDRLTVWKTLHYTKRYSKTRLISIESQPKKIIVVVAVVTIIVVVVVFHVVVVVIAVIDPRNLPLKFGLNQVINKWYVVDVVIVSIVVNVVVVVMAIVFDPRNLHLKFGSVTAEIILTLSLCGGGGLSHFHVNPNFWVELRFSWGCDNI